MKIQKNKTIALAIIMVICVVLTSLLLDNSFPCDYCEKKITGKYYLTIDDEPYCKKCGLEYYRGYPGNLDSVSGKVNNAARNILIIVEVVGIIIAIAVVNNKKASENIKREGIASATKKMSVMKNEIKRVAKPILGRETPEEPKPIVKKETPIETKPIVKKETPIETKPEIKTEVKPEVKKEAAPEKIVAEPERKAEHIPVKKETKVEEEAPAKTASSSRLKSTMRKSSSGTETEKSDRFTIAGDL